MTPRRDPRPAISLRRQWRGTDARTSWTERVLRALGAHPAFAEAVLGDLAEERAHRRAQIGPVHARWWYAREVIRSVPHLLWNAARHGGPRGRARVAAVLAAVTLLPLASLMALRLRDGPPAYLVIGSSDADDGLIVNGLRPVQLSVKVLDAAGHVLPSTGVRYHWESGAPTSVTPAGVITCAGRSDAVVRAALGEVGTSVRLRCRPVHDVSAPARLDLFVDGPSQDVPFEAFDSLGHPVTLLAGQIAVGDSAVATLTGSRIRGRAAGSTSVTVHMGDVESYSSVHVYQRVANLEGIRPGQHRAVTVRVTGGEMRRWHIPAGDYFLTIIPDAHEQERPRLAVIGANCVHRDEHLLCAAPHGASVIAYHPQDIDAARVLRGDLAVERREVP